MTGRGLKGTPQPAFHAHARAVLQEAVDYQASEFDRDQFVDGADMVEWFASWRERSVAR